MHRYHRNSPLSAGQHSFTAEGASWGDHGADGGCRQQGSSRPQANPIPVGLARRAQRHQIRRPAQTHQHAGQERMAQLLRRRPGIQIRIHRQRLQGRGMGAGDAQVAHQQMADHRLGAGQAIDPGAMAIGGQGLAIGIVGEAGHHGDSAGTCQYQLFAGAQQGIRALQAAPAGATGSQAQAHSQGLVADEHRADRQAQAGTTSLGRLNLALA